MAASQVQQYERDAKALANIVLRMQGDFQKAEELARRLRYAENGGDSRAWNVFGAGAIGAGVDCGAGNMLGWFAGNGEDANGSCFDIELVVSDLDEFVNLIHYAAANREHFTLARVGGDDA